MKETREPWKLYEAGRAYNNRLVPNQYTLVETNTEFLAGNQRLHLPDTPAMRDLPKPTFNILKRVASLFIASLTSSAIAIRYEPLTVYGKSGTDVKNHYKEYGLTALPTEKAYENWEKSLQGAMSAGAFETFLRKLNVSLSEDSKAAVDYLTGKYWPGMTAAQRQKVEKLYADYGMQYFYGS